MVRPVLLWLSFAPAFAFAQASTYDITFGGVKSGETVTEFKPDGSFSSKMNLKIGPVTVVSTMTGLIKSGLLVECNVDTTQAGITTKIIWKDSKVTATSGGKEVLKDKEYKPHLKAVFSIFHPGVNKLLWNAFGGKAKKEPALFLDSLAELLTDFKSKPQTVTAGGKSKTIDLWNLDLSSTQITMAFSSDGQPLGLKVPSQKIAWILQGNDGIFVDPLEEYKELSQPTFKVKTERRIRATMRDGTRLMADVSRPDAAGKFPVVLIRTPYGREASLSGEEWLVSRGYVVVSQDVRGRGGSDGEWDPLIHERKDGKDTLDWLVEQPWCDGKIGMIGGSYLGYVQWAAASSGHPALKCIIPQVSPPQPDSNFPWDHGSFMLLSDLWWVRVVKDRSSTTAGAFAPLKNLEALNVLPLTKADDKFFGENVPFFDKWLKRPTLDDWGDVFTTRDVAAVRIPALHVSGIWDGDGIGTALHWEAREGYRPNDRLVFGPWTHLFNTSHKFGDQEYGEHGILELESLYLRFFDTWLKGKSVKLDAQPRVQFFVTGSNNWIKTSSWPMPGAAQISWFLGAGNKAGSLGKTAPKGRDTFLYDPNKPSFKAKEVAINVTGDTTVIGKVVHRSTALTYRSEPFTQNTTLAGPIKVELYASSTGKDATFNVMVIDEDEKGVSRYVGLPGTQRATYVNGEIKLLTPGKPVKVEVVPWWFAHQFAKGHRLSIVVTSDGYPRLARNPGTGVPDWKATKLVKATQTIWTGPDYPSKVTLWKLPN